MGPAESPAPDQQIRFEPVTGGRVAVAVLGAGPPLVLPGPWISHVGLEWQFPEYRSFLLRLAERHTVIRYDRLGVGCPTPTRLGRDRTWPRRPAVSPSGSSGSTGPT